MQRCEISASTFSDADLAAFCCRFGTFQFGVRVLKLLVDKLSISTDCLSSSCSLSEFEGVPFEIVKNFSLVYCFTNSIASNDLKLTLLNKS